jgi:hypothetical protein
MRAALRAAEIRWIRAKKTKLHVDMVEAWLTERDLPSELLEESVSESSIRRVLCQAGR